MDVDIVISKGTKIFHKIKDKGFHNMPKLLK